MRNFRELRIWKESVQFSVDIYELLKIFQVMKNLEFLGRYRDVESLSHQT